MIAFRLHGDIRFLLGCCSYLTVAVARPDDVNDEVHLITEVATTLSV